MHVFAATSGHTSHEVWAVMACIAAAGAVGGFVNALLTSGGLRRPRLVRGVLRPGWLGNVILGAFAAVITWGLYGPLKDAVLVGHTRLGK